MLPAVLRSKQGRGYHSHFSDGTTEAQRWGRNLLRCHSGSPASPTTSSLASPSGDLWELSQRKDCQDGLGESVSGASEQISSRSWFQMGVSLGSHEESGSRASTAHLSPGLPGEPRAERRTVWLQARLPAWAVMDSVSFGKRFPSVPQTSARLSSKLGNMGSLRG